MSEQQSADTTTSKTSGVGHPGAAKKPKSKFFEDIEAIRISDPTELLDEKSVDVHLAVRKPKPREHFRVCGDENMSMTLPVYVHRPAGAMEEETYIVGPGMKAWLREQEELRVVQLVLCRTLSGALFLWPLPVADGNGPVRPHVKSARAVAQKATTTWVRMRWRRTDNSYYMLTAESVQTEPEWPDRTFIELLELAFGDKIIEDKDHPVILELRGIEPAKAETKSADWLS
jgi:hypothetical protein